MGIGVAQDMTYGMNTDELYVEFDAFLGLPRSEQITIHLPKEIASISSRSTDAAASSIHNGGGGMEGVVLF